MTDTSRCWLAAGHVAVVTAWPLTTYTSVALGLLAVHEPTSTTTWPGELHAGTLLHEIVGTVGHGGLGNAAGGGGWRGKAQASEGASRGLGEHAPRCTPNGPAHPIMQPIARRALCSCSDVTAG